MKKPSGKNGMMPGKMPMTNERKSKSEEVKEAFKKKEKDMMKKGSKDY